MAKLKKLMIYDLDGTLVDTRKDIAHAVNRMLSEMGAAQLSEGQIARHVGRGLYHLVGSCLDTNDKKKIEAGARLYRDYYSRHMLDNTVLFPGAKEILEYFKGQNQAVLTNKPNPFSQQILEALGTADYFIEILAGDSKFPKKPDPAAVHFLMERTGAGPHQTVLVGDSLIDIETGRNAGVVTVVVSHGFSAENELKSAAPDGIFRNFKELLAYARQEGW